jgi:hypothetical protein
LFTAIIVLLGGFSGDDTYESVFSTWAIAHGQLACAFPHGFRVTAPLYPLLSGVIAGFGHIGHTVPFPPQSAMGAHCSTAFLTINTWSFAAGAVDATLMIGYLGWFFLMAGTIALLRSTGRGRCGWEPLTLVVLACLPAVWTCVNSTFHPEDLIALGLSLGAVACARRGSWTAAGFLIGLAFLSQQFAVLVALPLLVLAPARRRIPFGLTGLITVAAVALPLILVTKGSAENAILFGTGTTGGIGGSVIWRLGLHGLPLLFLSRIMPIALVAVIAWVVVRRLGPRAFEPIVMLSLIAVSLSLRLVFEQQIFEYYFMALSVTLVLLDVVSGHIRGSLVAWILTVTSVFLGEIDTAGRDGHFRPALVLIAVAAMALLTLRGAPVRSQGPWITLLVATLVAWTGPHLLVQPTVWAWQILLVGWGVALAAGPLIAELRRHDTPSPTTLPRRPPRTYSRR